MTRAQRRTISRDFQRLQSQIERRYVAKIFNALKRQIKKVADDVKLFGIEFAIRRTRVISLDPVMTNTIRDMHVFTGLTVANRTLKELRRHSPKKMANLGFNEEWTRQILEYFNLHLLESVTSIDQTTRNHILKIMEQGFRELWSTEEIVKAINDKLYMKNRAARIARTESTRAAGYGVITGAGDYDYEVQKEWISIPDNRRRHSHANVEGEQRDLDKPFSNGLMFPGDPEGPPEETIFCRCTMAVVPKRDLDGQLIPKKPARIPRRGSAAQPIPTNG
jgi:hypothetical protein